jgi:hypothetical protein
MLFDSKITGTEVHALLDRIENLIYFNKKFSYEIQAISKVETYSRIGLLRSYENLQSYWTITKLWKLTVVLH